MNCASRSVSVPCLRLQRGAACGAGAVMAWGRDVGVGERGRWRTLMLPSLPGGNERTRYHGRGRGFAAYPRVLSLCISRCGAIATVEAGRFVRLDPDPTHPNGQALCAKGGTL